MIRKSLFILLFLNAICSISQTNFVKLKGNLNGDTALKQNAPNALLLAIKFKDSTLVNFTRSDKSGFFKPFIIPKDTYIVVVTHPNYSDKTYLLVCNPKDTAYNFKNIVLPPKTQELKEVEVLAYRDKIYYKGDTLQYTADSFKVRPNATVEDLLKKLPGMRVDAQGKITIQGKTVDQVLVDGDEFFGSDPTTATRNLNANTVETIQVFEKKNENTESSDETVKVLNLKLKDEAKKGYFGKANGASDFNKFYEGEFLFNRFKKQQKVSLFALVANTPRNSFNWQDNDKYGLSNEQQWNYNEDNGSWTSNRDFSKGIPQTLKSGIYFNDKIGKKIKVNADYTFNNNYLNTGSEINNQFFLTDTTYSNKQLNNSFSYNQSHNFNFKITAKLDSLTELIIRPRFKYNENTNITNQYDEFLTENNSLTRSTNINRKSISYITDAGVNGTIERKFMKKNRTLTLGYQNSFLDNKTNSNLVTDYKYYSSSISDKNLQQKRTQLNNKAEHDVNIRFIEPIGKKIKIDALYQLVNTVNGNNRNTLDFDSLGTETKNVTQSNNFINTRMLNRALVKFIYDSKKYRFTLGVANRNIILNNKDISNDIKLNRQFNFVLPSAGAVIRFSQNSNLNLNYIASATPPDLRDLQPVIDNTDPNRISIGNPNLKPSFTNNFNLNYYLYKGISDINFYGGANFNTVNNRISNTTFFDSIGRATTQPINTNGNYYGNFYLGGGFPVFKKFMKIDINLNGNHNSYVNIVNLEKNIQQNTSITPELNFSKQFEFGDFTIGGNYTYEVPKSTINNTSNKPFYSYSLNSQLVIKLPKKFSIESDVAYTNNGNRAAGFNLNFYIWNAALRKTFLKTESLILSAEANDILNQNISNTRTVFGNQITDTKTQIIKRFFLFRLVYKFTSQKAKVENDDDDM